MSFSMGETIGAYRLEEQLGQGGMATVYKAYHPALDRYVAIKALHPAFMEDASFLARFQREARLVAKLEHPNIVPIYDFSEHQGRPYLVMKFIEGETLKAHLQSQRLSLPEALRIVEAAGAALAYAHSQNVLHRDVKPSNVLLARDGSIYLADFGLARMAQGSASTLTADMLVGTPQYISPEQALSKPDLDARTDIYSFGVMLYEMMVGEVPFNADTPFATIHDHLYTPLPLPHLKNPAIPESIERILLKALAKDPDDRYRQMEDLTAAFRAAVQNAASVEIIPATPEQETLDFAAGGAPGVTPAPETTSGQGAVSLPPGKAALAQTPSYPPKEALKKPRSNRLAFWLLGAGAAGLLILLLGVGLGAAWFTRQQSLRNVSSTATPVVTRTRIERPSSPADPLNPSTRKILEDAVNAYRRGETQQAAQMLKTIPPSDQQNPENFKFMLNYLKDQQIPVLALTLVVINNQAEKPELLEMLRELAYMAAGDPKSGDFFSQNRASIFIAAALARYEILNGDVNKGKRMVDEMTAAPLQSRRFPEVYLAECEYYIKMGEIDKARKINGDLLAAPNLADWIRKFGEELKRTRLK